MYEDAIKSSFINLRLKLSKKKRLESKVKKILLDNKEKIFEDLCEILSTDGYIIVRVDERKCAEKSLVSIELDDYSVYKEDLN